MPQGLDWISSVPFAALVSGAAPVALPTPVTAEGQALAGSTLTSSCIRRRVPPPALLKTHLF